LTDASTGHWDAKAWFRRGMNWSEFLDISRNNVARMRQFYDEFKFSTDVISFYRARTPLNVLAIGEDWCPDVVHNLSLMARLADQIAGMDLRILKRDDNPELMERYLTNGARRIPVFVFFDAALAELGDWRGRCKSADAWILGEVTRNRKWEDMSRDELRAFHDEYDRRFWESYVDETLSELGRAMQ